MITILLLMCLIEPLRASVFTLKLEFHSYDNPNGWNSSKVCCDRGRYTGNCYSPCETMFSICLRNGDTSQIDKSCPSSIDIMTSGIVPGDSLTFGASIGSLPNPLTFSLDSLHFSGVQVYIKIEDDDLGLYDDDLNQDITDLIDELFLQIPSNGRNAAYRTMYGIHGVASVNASYRLACTNDNYYGNDCSVYCKPQNDESAGHYSCNETTGQKICLSGYVDPGRNCTCTVNNPKCFNTAATTISSTSSTTISSTSSATISSTSTTTISNTSTTTISSTSSATIVPTYSMLASTTTQVAPIATVDEPTHSSMLLTASASTDQVQISMTQTPTVQSDGLGSVIIATVITTLLLISVITIFVSVIILLLWKRKQKPFPDIDNTGTIYDSPAKNSSINGNNNLANPMYIDCPLDISSSNQHTYEFMDGPIIPGNPESIGRINEPNPTDYQTLYETPVDGICNKETVLIKSAPDPQTLDYEEPRDSLLNASCSLYETPMNPNKEYDTPWKKLF